MNKSIKFKDFAKICRCCLTYGELKPILDLKDIDLFVAITNIKVILERNLIYVTYNFCCFR